MNGTPFNNDSVRKAVIAFGSLFNNLSIERRLPDGGTSKTIKVPITFTDKASFYRKLKEDLDKENSPRKISRLLPRMAFDLSGLRVDQSRQLVPTHRIAHEVPLQTSSSSSSNADYGVKRITSYMRVPVTYDFDLSIAAKTIEDGLMILEQIIPFFKPGFSITVNDHTLLNVKHDMNVVLKNIQKESTRPSGFDESEILEWILSFEVNGYIYSPQSTQGVILSSIVNIYDNTDTDSRLVARVQADVDTDPGELFSIDDSDTYTTTITEYDYAPENSSSSSSSSG